MINKWDERFLFLAKIISSWSKDPSTKVGAIIVKDNRIVTTGYNGFPPNILDSEERLNNRELKYKYICHAEANSIIQCCNTGTSCNGADIYIYPFGPCIECSKLIIIAGIKRVIFPKIPVDLEKRWGESIYFAKNLISEAGLKIDEY
mgnify:CR=1 FL=1